MTTLGKREWIAVGVALVAATALFFGGQIWSLFSGVAPLQDQNGSQYASQAAATANATTMQNISTTKGLEIYDEQVGSGATATAGKTITAHYVGTLTNGTKFDSSVDRGQPFTFTLGAGQVIQGWDMGIQGMKVGGVRRLVIAPELAYGNRAIGPIPAGSTLIFEVQLLDVK
ncbi:MAG TPA: FKBP-type peptidyl-prolyl cis-trans isomerase [Candidatus Paceibacterota bacterium]|nr:FKBP-type peptidyl-prolyl cis-trans isomerase [Candidatus Paceibacterota bacterium]